MASYYQPGWDKYQAKAKKANEQHGYSQLASPTLAKIILSGAEGAGGQWENDPTFTYVPAPGIRVAGTGAAVAEFLNAVGAPNVETLTLANVGTPDAPGPMYARYQQLVEAQKAWQRQKKAGSSSSPDYSLEQFMAFSEALKGDKQTLKADGVTIKTPGTWSVVGGKADKSSGKKKSSSSGKSLWERYQALTGTEVIDVSNLKPSSVDPTRMIEAKKVASAPSSGQKKGTLNADGQLVVRLISSDPAKYQKALEIISSESGQDFVGLVQQYGGWGNTVLPRAN